MLPDLTLIVAATRNMGIGRHGALPWTGLKKEMAYFKRVTTRAPPQTLNAVVMGRSTWESIPARFRPLADRINVVLTSRPLEPPAPAPAATAPVLVAPSLGDALSQLESRAEGVGRVFIIGGASVYRAALESEGEGGRESEVEAEGPPAHRILLTRVETNFDCDTFFPIRLGCERDADPRWARSSADELDGWVGEAVPRGSVVENGTEYEFQMWESRGPRRRQN